MATLTALQLVNEILLNSDSDLTVSTITESRQGDLALSWLNASIEDIFNASDDWSWAERTDNISVVADTTSYSIPTGQDVDKIRQVRRTSDNRPLDYLDYDEFYRRKYEDANNPDETTTDGPLIYTIFDEKIELFFTPTAAATLAVLGKALPEELSADTDTTIIPTKYQRSVLLQRALYYSKLFYGDQDVDRQERIYLRNLSDMIAKNRKYGQRVAALRPEDY